MRLPNLNGVRAFECAARQLNFRLAAEELNLTQGAVAQQVRKLETSLGQKLFVRKPRGLELTEKGAAYFNEIHAALTRIEQATARLAPQSRSVVLSVPPSFASMWLMPRLIDFEARYPEVDLQVLASEKLADFGADGVDLVVRQAAPPFTADLRSVLLAPLDLVAVASPAYLETAPPTDELERFRAHRLLEDGHRHWLRLLGSDEIKGPAARVSRFNQTALAIGAARAGRGVAIAAETLVKPDIEAGDLKVVWRDETKSATGFYAVGLARTHRLARNRDQLAGWLCEQFGTVWS
ncbi:MAG: LysR substrate-binding domain-containing protein [Hoeflea sp.]|uniref:LysR substrate-binding domain-containing protein n=1 Tax=Hoeflea sp. TaxID=1940281 RepID=UPI0032990A3D